MMSGPRSAFNRKTLTQLIAALTTLFVRHYPIHAAQQQLVRTLAELGFRDDDPAVKRVLATLMEL